MKISLAPPTVLSGEICAQLKPQGLSIEPTVVIERNLMFEAPVVVAPGCRLNRMQIGAYSHIAPLSALQVATLGRYCTIGSKVEIGVGIMPTNLRHGTTKLKFKPVLFKDGL